MSEYDIFLSYAHEDMVAIRPLIGALEGKGWRVFWDRHIPPGETWRSFIGVPLASSPVVLVAWSKHSIDSNWVGQEADAANERGALIPLLLDRVRPPLGLAHIQAANLVEWCGGDAATPLPEEFSLAISRKLAKAAGAKPPTPEPLPGEPKGSNAIASAPGGNGLRDAEIDALGARLAAAEAALAEAEARNHAVAEAARQESELTLQRLAEAESRRDEAEARLRAVIEASETAKRETSQSHAQLRETRRQVEFRLAPLPPEPEKAALPIPPRKIDAIDATIAVATIGVSFAVPMGAGPLAGVLAVGFFIWFLWRLPFRPGQLPFVVVPAAAAVIVALAAPNIVWFPPIAILSLVAWAAVVVLRA